MGPSPSKRIAEVKDERQAQAARADRAERERDQAIRERNQAIKERQEAAARETIAQKEAAAQKAAADIARKNEREAVNTLKSASISVTPTSPYAIGLDIEKVLEYIGEVSIKPDNITRYLGSVNDITGFVDVPDTSLNFVQAILKGYVSFKTRYANSLPAIDMSSAEKATASINGLISKILIRNIENTTNVYTNGGPVVTTGNFLPQTTEINFSRLISDAGGDPILLDELNKIRLTYSLLSDDNIKKYKSGIPFRVSRYSVTNVKSKIVSDYTVDPKNSTQMADLNNIITQVISNKGEGIDKFDFMHNDIFVIRRLMLLYELLANIYIAMYIYDKSVDANVASTLQSSLLNIVTNSSIILKTLNENVKFKLDSQDQSRASIIQSIRDNISSYNDNSVKISEIDNSVRDLKTTLMYNKRTYESGVNNRTRMAKYEKIIIVVFVVCLLIMISFAIAPIERSIKLAICSSVLLLLIVSAIILDKIYNYNQSKEGFTNYYLPDPSVSNSGETIGRKDNWLSIYNQTFHAEALDYLYNTIYLTNLLQTNRAYNKLDSSMRRETKYFVEMQGLIENSSNKLSKYAANVQLDAAVSSARVTFFVSLGIVISAAIIAYIMIGNSLQYQPFVLGFTGLLIFFVLVRYLVEVSRYVRTDPSKFYWKRPGDTKSLNKL